MLANLFWLTNFSLLAASFFAIRLPEANRKFSLSILLSLLFLPLLIAEYLAVTLNFISDQEGFTLLFASQNLFLIIWVTAARRLRDTMFVRRPDPTIILGFLHAFVVVIILAVAVSEVLSSSFIINRDGIRASQYDMTSIRKALDAKDLEFVCTKEFRDNNLIIASRKM